MNIYKKTMFDLSDKIILITGGAGTLGRQYAQTVASAGGHAIVGDIDKTKCENIAKKITDLTGSKCLGIYLDVSSIESIREAIQKIIYVFGRIDVLVNNAGVSGKFNTGSIAPAFEDYPLSEWQKALDVNITGMFLCTQAVGIQMIKKNSGVIINISSIHGLLSPDQRIYQKDSEPDKQFIKPISYSVSKSAVLNFTRYLATYYAKWGIRVNTLTPGGVDDGTVDKEFKGKYSEKTPLGRMASPDDFNGAILYLCSNSSKYMTGSNIVVDGGWTAW